MSLYKNSDNQFLKLNSKLLSKAEPVPATYYYLSYFTDVEDGIDNPIESKDAYKWNLNSGLYQSKIITPDIITGRLPSTYIGKSLGFFKQYATDIFNFPQNTNFSWQFWGRRGDASRHGAGGFLGFRTHQDWNELAFAVGNAGQNWAYSIDIGKGERITADYRNSSLVNSVQDFMSYKVIDSYKTEWDFYSFEWDNDNKVFYCYINGQLALMFNNCTFNYEFTRAMGDGERYDEPVWICELAVFEGLKSTGEGSSKTYPVPTEPLV